jgi:anaerobic selenocysteine-containing dehydrogenase
MDRRNFFKIVSTVSGAVATNACGDKQPLIPLLVPEHAVLLGEEQWHPAICSECAAGCGTIVRVMAGERVIERQGEKFRERIASIKKIEGNPLDPVSGGRLCARGHAALQSLYNPDRLRGPMRRTGARGEAKFAPVSWDEALKTTAAKLKAHAGDEILFLTSAPQGTRALAIQRFLEALKAPPARTCGIGDFAVERQAAEWVFGWKGVPVYDLAHARYVLGVGADFLGGWISPVYYGRHFGDFRQGRGEVRGHLVQAESRMSITAASADEWLPVRPGSEPHLLVALSHMLLEQRPAGQLPDAIAQSIRSADLAALIRTCGIEEKRLRRVANELGKSEAPLVIAGASIVQSNSFEALVAAHYLNLLLGARRLLPPQPEPQSTPGTGSVIEAIKRAKILFLDGENPAYLRRAAQSLAGPGLIVSFGSFLDDSAAYADVLLPDHHPLESEAAVVPLGLAGVAVAQPFVRPLYDTQPIERTLGRLGVAFEPVSVKDYVAPMLPPEETWENVARQGGYWKQNSGEVKVTAKELKWTDPVFAGKPEDFPFQFQPYLSLQFHDGRGANLPWMQELPDPVSSAMWGLPVEIDPATAEKLKVNTGDWLRVESESGHLDAPAYVHPAALPGVVSMAIGDGHTHYGRYASGRGANPLSILSPVADQATGEFAFGATRVRVAKLERNRGELIQFSPQDKEQGPWGQR